MDRARHAACAVREVESALESQLGALRILETSTARAIIPSSSATAELAPRYWRITRARHDELDHEVGWLTIPEPLPTMPAINLKDPKHYTPTTIYDDRAITPSLFHWESQSRTRADSDTGRRCIASATSDSSILLFVRHQPDDDRGFTSPSSRRRTCSSGASRYVLHESEKPMRITWRLDQEMPLDFFSDIKSATG